MLYHIRPLASCDTAPIGIFPYCVNIQGMANNNNTGSQIPVYFLAGHEGQKRVQGQLPILQPLGQINTKPIYEELVSKTSYIHPQHVTHLHY